MILLSGNVSCQSICFENFNLKYYTLIEQVDNILVRIFDRVAAEDESREYVGSGAETRCGMCVTGIA